nr:truncated envelope glycoprotein [Human immunodeficiency virus 1]
MRVRGIQRNWPQ